MVLGSGIGVLLIVGLVMLVAGLFTGSPLPLPGWPSLVHGEAGNPAATPVVAPNAPESSAPKATPTPKITPTSQLTPTSTPTTHGNPSHRPSKTPR